MQSSPHTTICMISNAKLFCPAARSPPQALSRPLGAVAFDIRHTYVIPWHDELVQDLLWRV